MVTAAAIIVDYVQSHGFIANPKPSWKKGKTENQEWIVEIEPQWKGDWDKVNGDKGLLALFKELGTKNNFKDLRSLFEGNPIYGEECGYTDPKGPPADRPNDGAATFSRGILHAGTCEIWFDDKMVLQNDDCQSAYGDGTKKTISVLKPVDYGLCAPEGCMLRFYWLALQRIDKTVWQVYRNCIPLKGSGGGGGKDSDPTQESPVQEDVSSKSKSDSDSSKKSDSDSSKKSDSDSSKETDSDTKSDEDVTQVTPTTDDSKSPSPTPDSNTSSDKTPEITPAPTPAPSSKCKGQRRRN
ncbi:uncharacterized protein PHALS_10635 [Plasmopara halstedii]|uniref:Uncharacterized protein n=1 Tax=Plasmopara halstedii TaxID=4781 RepID=A0A0P1AH10_PLAHL|nr:uncharacterized protein PHALS_10635 [Plasmopara halstedii]CEG40436.1 hypothetical protein PHALS_10635 [Plasmopara halstedii]|eukprot:XP_024576805.1 hypothetical protein PHALS_10635 [Plasmopara halstedii]